MRNPAAWGLGSDGRAHWAPLLDRQAVCGAILGQDANDEPRCRECAGREANGRPDWATIARWAATEAAVAGAEDHGAMAPTPRTRTASELDPRVACCTHTWRPCCASGSCGLYRCIHCEGTAGREWIDGTHARLAPSDWLASASVTR